MRPKQKNRSQRHQVHSQNNDFKTTKSNTAQNRSHIHLEEFDAREILGKFDEEHHHNKHILLEQNDIIGWEVSHRQQNSKKAVFFQKQIKPHQKRPYHGRLEPLNTKNIEKCSTNDTINYLKQMLCLLRSSRQNNNPDTSSLKQRNSLQPVIDLKTIILDTNQSCLEKPIQRAMMRLPRQIIEKQNQYNDAQIINQLKNGLTKLPSIHQSKKSTISIRKINKSRFTLDKLLI